MLYGPYLFAHLIAGLILLSLWLNRDFLVRSLNRNVLYVAIVLSPFAASFLFELFRKDYISQGIGDLQSWIMLSVTIYGLFRINEFISEKQLDLELKEGDEFLVHRHGELIQAKPYIIRIYNRKKKKLAKGVRLMFMEVSETDPSRPLFLSPIQAKWVYDGDDRFKEQARSILDFDDCDLVYYYTALNIIEFKSYTQIIIKHHDRVHSVTVKAIGDNAYSDPLFLEVKVKDNRLIVQLK